MSLRAFILTFFLVVLIQNQSFANPTAPISPQVWQAKGEQLVKSGEWDRAETAFFKATLSPHVDERIKAYQSLIALYEKVKVFKKAERTKIKLQKEKEFKKSLVPEMDSYYQDYKVQKGDSYHRIALKHKVSREWLIRVNHNRPLKIDEIIKLPRVNYSLIVDKRQKKLIWKRGSEILKTYSVSIGKLETKTPEGEFVIANKIKDPVWYREKEIFPPNSPKNLLGTRWLGLDHKGYGIHGTRDPKSIGRAASHGCVRMHNYDVEELFVWVPIGTKVQILNNA